jgi:molybdate-binding protein
VCAVARGEVDVGLASLAWAARVGLDCAPLYREAYGLLVRASLLGDPGLGRLCEMAQSADFRRQVASVHGYQAHQTGTISYERLESNGRAGAADTDPSPRGRPS